MKGRSFVRGATATILKRAQLASLLCGILGIASKLLVSSGTLASPNATGLNSHEPSGSQVSRKAPPPAHFVHVRGFCMEDRDATNAEFSKFVEATEYVTTAEHKIVWEDLKKELPLGMSKPGDTALAPGALIFTPTSGPIQQQKCAQCRSDISVFARTTINV